MKVKDLYFCYIEYDTINQVLALTRKNSFVRLARNYDRDEYVSVYSGKHYWLKTDNVIPVELLLKIEDDRKNISKKSLKKLMIAEKDTIIEELKKDKTKKISGFKG